MSDTSGIAGQGGIDHRGLAALAASQDGLFTAQQAEGFGVTRQLLSHHAKTGRYERQAHGLYSVPEIPASPFRTVVAAWLLAGGETAVVSHETALALHDLSDIIVDEVHLTIPRSRRSRKPPAGAVVHTRLEPYDDADVQSRHFVRATAPAVTILDCLENGSAIEQVEMAISQAIDRGWISPDALRARAAQRGRRTAKAVDRLLRQLADHE